MSKRELIIRFLLNLIVNIFIFNKIKIFLYNTIFGYKISFKAKLGLFNIILCKELEMKEFSKIGESIIYDCNTVLFMKNSKIYRFTQIRGANVFILGENSMIGVGTIVNARERDRKVNGVIGGGRFIVGKNCTITKSHYFDITGSILLKNNVVIGGQSSLFYTHGFDCYGNFSYGNIIIGHVVYVGAACVVLPGIKINNEVVIGAGSVVPKSLLTSGCFVGNPIRKVSDNPKLRNKVVSK